MNLRDIQEGGSNKEGQSQTVTKVVTKRLTEEEEPEGETPVAQDLKQRFYLLIVYF